MIKPKTLSNRALGWLAASLALGLFVFEAYIVGVDHANYFLYLIDEEPVVFIGLALICLGISYWLFFRFVRFLVAASLMWRIVGLTVLALSLVIEYGYQKALGRFTDKVDFETAVAATPDQQIASVLMYINPLALFPIAAVIAVLLFAKAEKRQGFRHFAFATGSMIVAFTVIPFVAEQKFPTFATAAFFRTSTDLFVYGPLKQAADPSALGAGKAPRRAVRKPELPADHKPQRNIVVVIDESVMGDHFSLNGYARKTTPFLDDLASREILHNWGIAAAASTGSRFTYNALITGLGPDDFPDRTEFKVNTFPTVFQFAKAMGYTTYFLDGQMNGYWGANADDRNYIDSWQGIIDITDGLRYETWQVDEMLARKVKAIVNSSSGNFIMVFKHGSHIPYHINYPLDRAVWQPAYVSAGKFDIPSGDQLPGVVNAYDNSIRYNVNSFFEALIDDYSAIPNGTVVLYTGDHGQTLFANGRSSHGGNTKAEATVPLFIIGDIEAKPDVNYRASHGNIFPTLLDLLEYPEELRESARFPSLLKAKRADSRQRFFNPDLGTKVSFD